MNRWIEAKRVFDRAINSRWKTNEAAAVAEYCLKHNKNHIAWDYAKVLKKGVENPVVTLTYSKLLSAIKDDARALAAAERAYYLAAATGTDPADAKRWLNSLTNTSVRNPRPNKTYESVFWSKFDKLLMRDSCSMGVRGLAESPTFINGSIGLGGQSIIVGLKSDALRGGVWHAVLQYANDYAITGIVIEPNILTCCLNKQDVLNHLKSISSKNGKAPYMRPADGLPVNEEYEQIQVELDKKNVTFVFRKKGFAYLTIAHIVWNTKGPKLFKDKPPRQPNEIRDWKSYFEASKKELHARHFKDCRRNLCRAFAYWFGHWREGAIDFDNKRQEYETLKEAFVSLYESWGCPEIAEYFRIVPYPQLERDLLEVDGEMVVDSDGS